MRTFPRSRLAASALAVLTAVGTAGVATAGAAAAAVPDGCDQNGRTVTCEFTFTGAERAVVVPDGVTSMTATLAGAAGGDFVDRGGPGAVVTGVLTTTPGATLYVVVGEGLQLGRPAFNGGGSGDPTGGAIVGGAGGGATDIRTATGGTDPSATGLDSRLVVAGGGGGAGGGPGAPAGGDGVPATSNARDGQGGKAGTPSAGGAGGVLAGGNTSPANNGGTGTLGRGGAGGISLGAGGGGGGGGLYGGGGGSSTSGVLGARGASGSGGGGSSLVPAGFTLQGATNTGNGSVQLSWTVPATAGAIAATSGGGQSAQVGTAFAQPLVTTVTDPFDGAPVPGAVVTYSVTAGSATFPNGTATTTATTGADGRAAIPFAAGSTAGPLTVTATTPGVTAPAQFSATVTAAPPGPDRADLIATLTIPTSLRSGASAQVTLTVRNAGPRESRRVVSGIALPAGLTVTNGGGGTVTDGKRAVGWTAASIAANATATYTITVTADRSATGSRPVGGGVLSTATRDPNLGNNYQVKLLRLTR